MTAVVIHDAFAQAAVGSLLFVLDQRGVNPHTSGVNVLREALGRNLACHLCSKFSMDCILDQFALDNQGLIQCGLILGIGDVLQFVHSAQDILLAKPGALGVGNRVIS